MKSKTINATKSTGSSSNNIEVDVDTIRSILVHPNLKTAEIDVSPCPLPVIDFLYRCHNLYYSSDVQTSPIAMRQIYR